MPQLGYSDGEVKVVFKTGFDIENSVAGKWVVAMHPDELPIYISSEGTKVIIVEGSKTNIDRALQVRRAIPYASYLQNKTIVHASSVLCGGGVLGFVGESGAGKSTLARELDTQGFRLISDDLLPIRVVDETVVFPYLDCDKPSMYPIHALFFLTRKKELENVVLKSISKSQGLKLLFVNAFGDLKNDKLWSYQFYFFSNLVRSTKCFLLEIPDDKARLKQAAADILKKFDDLK